MHAKVSKFLYYWRKKMANLKDGDDSTAEPKPIAFENNEPSNEEAEALALSPIPENEKCEFQRSEIEET